MKVKGRVSHIIKRDKYDNYFGMYDTSIINTDSIVVIEKEDFPKSIFKRILYLFKNRKYDFSWAVMVDNPNFKEGDVVGLEVEKVMEQKRLGSMLLFLDKSKEVKK